MNGQWNRSVPNSWALMVAVLFLTFLTGAMLAMFSRKPSPRKSSGNRIPVAVRNDSDADQSRPGVAWG